MQVGGSSSIAVGSRLLGGRVKDSGSLLSQESAQTKDKSSLFPIKHIQMAHQMCEKALSCFRLQGNANYTCTGRH